MTDCDLNYDFDGDGVLDSYAQAVDTDGDGYADTLCLDTNNDGVIDAYAVNSDTDGDGVIDTYTIDFDTNHDGVFDLHQEMIDSDGNGGFDTIVTYKDYDQNGEYDEIMYQSDTDADGVIDKIQICYDTDNDGFLDTIESYYDFDNDGNADAQTLGQFIDSDGDGVADKFVLAVDKDYDHVYESLNVHEFDADTGEITSEPVEISEVEISDEHGDGNGIFAENLDVFDPENGNYDQVIGNPGAAMEYWESQDISGPCAIYSQKFVIEELTGQEIDIDDLIEVAIENGWYDSDNSGTAALNMDKLLDYYGIDSDMSFHNDVEDIIEALANGDKVIVSIDADEIWCGESDDVFMPNDSANHAVEVIGVVTQDGETYVVLNDSGNSDGGCGEMIPVDTFVDAWDDGSNQMIVI